jgi:hypothetical protein
VGNPTIVTSLPKRELPVDLEELCIALEAEAADLRWFLDCQTGAVLLVTHEYEPAENGGLTVTDIETDPLRFVRVPGGDPQHALDDMTAFAHQLADGQLKESLELALSAPRPEKRFKTALSWLPEQQERWHQFRLARCRERAEAWLARQGIVPVAAAA